MSLLTLVQKVARRVGTLVPTAGVFTSIDTNVQQIIELATEAGEEIAHRYEWQALTKEATFTAVNVESQGTIQTLTGPDYVKVLNDTMWDRTTRRPVYGPKYAAEWQQLKAQLMQGPWWQYRIRGNNLLFLPPPAAGDQIFFEWISGYWVATGTNTSVGAQRAFAADSDVSLLSERTLVLDAIWRYKSAKGLAFEADYDKAEAAIADDMTGDASKPRLNLAGAQSDIYPGILVPAGNWGIS